MCLLGVVPKSPCHQGVIVTPVTTRLLVPRGRPEGPQCLASSIRGRHPLVCFLKVQSRFAGQGHWQGLGHVCASLGRSEHHQGDHLLCSTELRGTRNQTPGWSPSTWHQTPQEKLGRMDHNVGQALRSEEDIPASGRSERRQRGRRVSFSEPQTSRSRSPQRSCSTWHQTLREKLRRMERDEGRALRPERDSPSSSGWSEHHQRGRRIPFTEPQVARN